MKNLIVLLCAATVPCTAFSQSLTSADREALLDQLDSLRDAVDTRNDARFAQAISAYRAAMASDANTVEFYLKCVEKVEYTDTKRKARDFRDWKKKEDANLKKPGFRRALRHQLRWLTLSLEAASSTSDQKTILSKAKAIVSDVFEDLELMADQERVLNQSAVASVFAKAYDIDGTKAEGWPSSPMDLKSLYDDLFLPPLREDSNLTELRAMWLKRIDQELAIRENMARYARRLQMEQQRQQEEYITRNSPNETNNEYNETRIGTVESMLPPEYRQYLADEVPELLWLMEMDLFKCGDQSGAARRMVTHLQKYSTHKSAGNWNDEFTALLKAAEESTAGTSATGMPGEPEYPQ